MFSPGMSSYGHLCLVEDHQASVSCLEDQNKTDCSKVSKHLCMYRYICVYDIFILVYIYIYIYRCMYMYMYVYIYVY